MTIEEVSRLAYRKYWERGQNIKSAILWVSPDIDTTSFDLVKTNLVKWTCIPMHKYRTMKQ